MTTEPAAPVRGATTDAADDIAAMPFDAAFELLRAVVAELEAGGLSLEETITRTERAVALQRHCERLLTDAELRVQQLINRPGGGLGIREIAADEASELAEG